MSVMQDESKEDRINDQCNLRVDLSFDSVQLVNLVIEIEDEFNIEFADEILGTEDIYNFAVLKELISRELNIE